MAPAARFQIRAAEEPKGVYAIPAVAPLDTLLQWAAAEDYCRREREK